MFNIKVSSSQSPYISIYPQDYITNNITKLKIFNLKQLWMKWKAKMKILNKLLQIISIAAIDPNSYPPFIIIYSL